MTIVLNGSDLTVTQVDVVRGAMLCLANSYAKGVTGVRPELAEMVITLLNEGFAPPVRWLGSIGQGDLGPMADLAHGLITRSGFEVAENEGLALVSSNAFTTAWACLAIADAEALLRHRWFTPHTWTNGLGLLANLHVVAGLGGGPYVEFPYDPPGWTEERRDFFLTEPVRIDADGCLNVPDQPGLGASIDHAAVARYRRS